MSSTSGTSVRRSGRAACARRGCRCRTRRRPARRAAPRSRSGRRAARAAGVLARSSSLSFQIDGGLHAHRAGSRRFQASCSAFAGKNRRTEHRPDGAGRVLPQLPVALVPRGGRGAGDRAAGAAGARDRLRNDLRGMEDALPIRARAATALLILAACLLALAAAGCGKGQGAGVEPDLSGVKPGDDAPSPGAPTDAEVRAELKEARAALSRFKQFLNTTAYLATGPRARVLPDGTAQAPSNAPEVVKRVILAANQIAKFPYKWGGGHGAWRDSGYDCSGSVSFALAGAGLLDRPLTSGLLAGYGAPGPSRWITIYANPGHVFMVVAGLRFDTSGQGRAGTR